MVDEKLALKQDILTFDNDLVLNSIVVKPRATKSNYNEAIDGQIICDSLYIGDENVMSLISNNLANIDLKQDKLTAGANIEIIGNEISSTGGGDVSQSDLDLKQDILNDDSTNEISLYKAIVTNIETKLITYNGTTLETLIATKQDKVTSSTE